MNMHLNLEMTVSKQSLFLQLVLFDFVVSFQTVFCTSRLPFCIYGC